MIIDQLQIIKEMNEKIHKPSKAMHVERVANIINLSRLTDNIQISGPLWQLQVAAYAHDICKDLINCEDGQQFIEFTPTRYPNKTFLIPTDARRYVRMNLDVLEPFGLDYYFNSDIGYHALASGIFICKEMRITDPDILYAVFMHSCPLIDVYKTLPVSTQNIISILTLADKIEKSDRHIAEIPRLTDEQISKNIYYQHNLRETVFGKNGNEMNITAGMFMIRYMEYDQNKDGVEARNAYNYFYEELRKANPWLSEKPPVPFANKK